MTDEKWKIIDGAPEYEVSDHGNVRRSQPAPGTPGGLLRSAPNADGYHVVQLSIGGKPETRYVHDLVSKAFMSSPGKGFSVQHKDHDRSHNHRSNLEWIEAATNSGDGRLTKEKLRAIRADIKRRRNSLTIAMKHNVALRLVVFIRKNYREEQRAKT